jgi:hypothetical protein
VDELYNQLMSGLFEKQGKTGEEKIEKGKSFREVTPF